MSLKSLEACTHLIVEMSASKKVEEGNWFNSDEICEIYANQNSLELTSIDLFQTLMEHEVTLCEIEREFINIFSLTFPFVPIFIFFISIFVSTRLFIVDATKLVNLLLDASPPKKQPKIQFKKILI